MKATTNLHRNLLALLLPAALAACAAGDDEVIELSSFDPGAGIAADAPVGRTTMRLPDGETREVSFDVVGDRAIAEGDIDLGPADRLLAEDGRTPRAYQTVYKWPSGVIRYKDPALPNRKAVEDAIAELHARTDLHFVKVSDSYTGNCIDWAMSLDPGVSSSPVGMQGGTQVIRIWPLHGKSVVMHEILHSVGLWHEQSRLDRDQFVFVNLICVPPARWHNFDKRIGVFGGTYDLESIMHYDDHAFSISADCPSILKWEGGKLVEFDAKNTLSAKDIAGINLLN